LLATLPTGHCDPAGSRLTLATLKANAPAVLIERHSFHKVPDGFLWLDAQTREGRSAPGGPSAAPLRRRRKMVPCAKVRSGSCASRLWRLLAEAIANVVQR
jgi:hypothetical protein